MGVREGKNYGGGKKFARLRSGLCPRCQKNFPEKLSKIVVEGAGSGYENYSY
jgi:hypothetical protein